MSYTIQEIKTLVNRIEGEQLSRNYNQSDITRSEIEILGLLLFKVNSMYGCRVTECMTTYETDSLFNAMTTIRDYLEEN